MRCSRGLSFVLLVFFVVAAEAQVVRTWVSTMGVDNPACSRSAPCRTFSAGVAAVDWGGEVVALDSGGYGPVTISKPVSIVAPRGIHAAIAPTSGTAIAIAAGTDDVVRLANLQLTSQGSTSGIAFTVGSVLSIESCTVDGFTTGISLETGVTSVYDTFVRRADTALRATAGAGYATDAKIDRSRIEGSNVGVKADGNSRVVVVDSVMTANTNGAGVYGTGDGFAELTVIGSDLSMNMYGVFVSGQLGQGIPVATLRLADSSIVDNGIAIWVSNGVPSDTLVLSAGNNTIHGNGETVHGGSLTSMPLQ